jgi:hypothetical protein
MNTYDARIQILLPEYEPEVLPPRDIGIRIRPKYDPVLNESAHIGSFLAFKISIVLSFLICFEERLKFPQICGTFAN